MPREYMGSMSLTSQFRDATATAWAQGDHNSFSSFLRNCREGNHKELLNNMKHITGAHLASGMLAAIQHSQYEIAQTLMAHIKPSQHDFEEAAKKNDVEMLQILNQNKIIQQEYSDKLLPSAITANASDAIHYLVENGCPIDTSAHGDVHFAGMTDKGEALEALLQHVTFVDRDCTYDIHTRHVSYPPVTGLLKLLDSKKEFLDTLHKYQHYQKHLGTAPARPSKQKVKDFAANSIAAMISRHTPVLTQDAIDDFHENKYKKKQPKTEKKRQIGKYTYLGGCL